MGGWYVSSNDYLWNLRLHMNVTKVEKFVQFIHGDESTQVDGFDTQNISSVFYAFEAFFNNYNPSEWSTEYSNF